MLINDYEVLIMDSKNVNLPEMENCNGNCCGENAHPTGKFENDMPDIETLYDLSEFFKVFGDTTRISIIATLFSAKELCVRDIADSLNMGQSAISHQLRILRSAGLIRPRRDGKTIYYSLDDCHVNCVYQMGLTHILHRHGDER